MKKAKKLRRTAGMIASMSVVILSFFPIICVEGGNVNIIQMVTHEQFKFTLISSLLLAAYLFVPVMSLVNYWAYLRKKEGTGKMVLSTYITIFGLLSVSGISAYYTEVSGAEVKFPGITIWVIFRMVCGFFEAVNRMSGEELFERVLKEQL